MKSPEVQFTPEDRLILDSTARCWTVLAQYLGTGYELVLHSLEDLEHSAIRVMNSDTLQRGALITELALTMLGMHPCTDPGGYGLLFQHKPRWKTAALWHHCIRAVNSESSGYCVSIFMTSRFQIGSYSPHRASL